jgi:hypothetical protein
MWKFRPKGRSPVSSLTRRISASMRSAGMVAPARKPKPPALVVAATRLEPATQPMAVCTMG